MCDKERQAVIVGVGRYTQSQYLDIEQCTTPVGMQASFFVLLYRLCFQPRM
jgi:hypothetical protein